MRNETSDEQRAAQEEYLTSLVKLAVWFEAESHTVIKENRLLFLIAA